MDEAERCSHVGYIYYGKLIADGTPNSLRELPDVTPAGTIRVEITTPEVTRALKIARQIPGIRSATIFGQSIHALIEDHFDLEDLREQLFEQGIAVAEIRPLAPTPRRRFRRADLQEPVERKSGNKGNPAEAHRE